MRGRRVQPTARRPRGRGRATDNGPELRVGQAPASPRSPTRSAAAPGRPELHPTSPPVWLPRSGGRRPGRGRRRPAQVLRVGGRSDRVPLAGRRGRGHRGGGRRPTASGIALIAGGQLYVVPVAVDRPAGPASSAPRELTTTLTGPDRGRLERRDRLVGRGRASANQRAAIFDVTVDGARRDAADRRRAAARSSTIAAYPDNTVARAGPPPCSTRPTTWPGGRSARRSRSAARPSPASRRPASPGAEERRQPTAPFFVY